MNAVVQSPHMNYADSVVAVLDEFRWNQWFLDTYWPENEPRVRLIAEAITRRGVLVGGRLLEVGCANGWVALLARKLGYEVTGVDAYDDEKRASMFAREGINYLTVNLNELGPFDLLSARSYDVVLLGEVFEHILNNPADLLRSIHRILRPGGLLVLTTPNPSTVMNAVRILLDRYQPWGTAEFLRQAKIEGERIIDFGGIHYREYPARIVADLLREVGFDVRSVRYVPTGPAKTQSRVKRLTRRLLRFIGLAHHRLFATNYVIVAKRRD